MRRAGFAPGGGFLFALFGSGRRFLGRGWGWTAELRPRIFRVGSAELGAG